MTFDGAPVDILVLWLLQSRILVEQIGNKSQVELGVAADDVCGHDELPAAKLVSLIQHALGPLQVVFLLQRQQEVGAKRSGGLFVSNVSDLLISLTLIPDMSTAMGGIPSSSPLGATWFRML